MITAAIHFALFLTLSLYQPTPRAQYRPWVSLGAAVIAGAAAAQGVAALLAVPLWPGPTTAGALVLVGLLVRSHGNLSHIFSRVCH